MGVSRNVIGTAEGDCGMSPDRMIKGVPTCRAQRLASLRERFASMVVLRRPVWRPLRWRRWPRRLTAVATRMCHQCPIEAVLLIVTTIVTHCISLADGTPLTSRFALVSFAATMRRTVRLASVSRRR
jgi:hypothetical protein